MDPCIFEVKTKVDSIISDVSRSFPDLNINLAFVGYRDISDGDMQFSVQDFVNSIDAFKRYVNMVEAHGGKDRCEDIYGAIQKVLGCRWKHQTRIVIHFADAPCHGQEFHDYDSSQDDYLNGYPEDSSIHDLLETIKSRQIQYWFVHLNDSTSKMVKQFKRSLMIHELNMTDGFENLVSTLSASISESIIVSGKMYRPVGGKHIVFSDLSAVSEASSTLEYTIKSEYPRYLRDLRVMKYICSRSESFNDHGFKWKAGRTLTIKIADDPFNEGAGRICYHGLDEHKRNVVLKEFKNTAKNTKVNYQHLVETSIVADFLAREFNLLTGIGSYGLKFLVPELVKIKDVSKWMPGNRIYYCMEPYLTGDYIKYNNNCGYINRLHGEKVLSAFSHWTYKRTGGHMMVVDLQGVLAGDQFTLTDPAIHCEGPDQLGLLRFGTSNLGQKGMTKFFKTHTCNTFCQNLKLVN